MKFIKGVMLGTIVTASAMLLYSGNIDDEKKKMVKKGKQFARKIGLY
jgi:gas vesicle protein